MVSGALLLVTSNAPPAPVVGSTTASVASGPSLWPLPNGDLGGTRSTTAAPALDGVLAWERDLGVELVAPPVADAERLYLTLADDRIVALDTGDGRELWAYQAPHVLRSAPAVVGDRLYLTLVSGSIVALSAISGDIVWEVRTEGSFFVSPAVADGVVYAYGAGEIFGLDAADGRRLWRAETGSSLAALAPVLDERYLVVAAGRRVRLYDRESGERTFRHPHRNVAGLILAEGRAFSVSPTFAAAVDRESREPWWEGLRGARNQLWTLGVASEPPRPAVEWINTEPLTTAGRQAVVTEVFPPAFDGTRLVVTTIHGLVRAYAAGSGETLWELQLDDVAGPPTFTGAGLLLTTSGGLSLRDPASGAEVARLPLPPASARTAIVTEHGTYVADDAGQVRAFQQP